MMMETEAPPPPANSNNNNDNNGSGRFRNFVSLKGGGGRGRGDSNHHTNTTTTTNNNNNRPTPSPMPQPATEAVNQLISAQTSAADDIPSSVPQSASAAAAAAAATGSAASTTPTNTHTTVINGGHDSSNSNSPHNDKRHHRHRYHLHLHHHRQHHHTNGGNDGALDDFEANPKITASPRNTPPKKIWEGAYRKFLSRGSNSNNGKPTNNKDKGKDNGGGGGDGDNSSPTTTMMIPSITPPPATSDAVVPNDPSASSSIPPPVPGATASTTTSTTTTTAAANTNTMKDGKKSSSFSILPGTKRLVTMNRSSSTASHGHALAAAPATSTDIVHQATASQQQALSSSDHHHQQQQQREASSNHRGVGGGGKFFHSIFSNHRSSSVSNGIGGGGGITNKVAGRHNRVSSFHGHDNNKPMDDLDVPMRKGIQKSTSQTSNVSSSPDSKSFWRKSENNDHEHGGIHSGMAVEGETKHHPAVANENSTAAVADKRRSDSETPSLDDLLASASDTPESQHHMTISVGNLGSVPDMSAMMGVRSASTGGLIHPMINESVLIPPSAASSSLLGGVLQPRVRTTSSSGSSSVQGNNFGYYNGSYTMNLPPHYQHIQSGLEGGNGTDYIPPPPQQKWYTRTSSGGSGSWSQRVPSSPVHQVGLALDDSDSASDDHQSTPRSQHAHSVYVVEAAAGNLDQALRDATGMKSGTPPTVPRLPTGQLSSYITPSEKKRAFTKFHNSTVNSKDSTSPFLGADDELSASGDMDQGNNMNVQAMLSQGGRPPDNFHHSVSGISSSSWSKMNAFQTRMNSMPHLASASLPLETVDEQNVSIHKGMRLLRAIAGTKNWEQDRRYLITPAILSSCSLPVINKLSGPRVLSAPDAVQSPSSFGIIDLGEALMTYVGEKHHLSLGKWSSCRLVLRQNYLFEYDVDTPITGSPRGFCHLQHAVAYPHQDFYDALELQFYASPCAKGDQRVLMIRIQRPSPNSEHLVDERNHWVNCLNNAARLQIEDLWNIEKKNSIGNGRYASIYPATRRTKRVCNEEEPYGDDETTEHIAGRSSTPRNCALKIIDKNEFWRMVVKKEERRDTLVREVAVQATMTASCGKISSFVKITGIFESSNNLVIELELLDGFPCIDLFDFISSKGVLEENEAALVMHDTLSCLESMNRVGLAHRDVKPANILMVDQGEDTISVKLADFGMSTFVDVVDGTVLGRCGTPGYAAPEILRAGPRSSYSGMCDVFSAGVTLYVMLSGFEPFYGETEKELREANKEAVIEFPDSDWASVSPEAIDLLRKMLQPDPRDRISAKEALQHEWIRRYAASKEAGRHGSDSLGNSLNSRIEGPVGGACLVS
eukprot:CAMPEP_0113476750 /NCGR_PEP_ID=MMETSP0014_2-20120614/19836_1 /TAXON_ID=2857 /ORGANISM="Nitzschia sp." /LENGTH=1341 /DNA_ID=CAMNT_0000369789 /DNA_START=297 /DNA_END=4322 /DNA_ORIENTATION=- /assembly_acc=CAM_ASM_000159